MPGLSEDPILTLQNLLVDNWNPANTSSITPRIHTGSFNHSWAQAQVAILDPTEFPTGGGETGFRGIESTTGNGVKFMIGRVTVGCYSHDDDNSGQNPRKLRFEMSEEIKRIIKANLYLVGTDLCWVSWLGRASRVDPDAQPTLFWYDNTINYMYIDRV